MGSTAGQNSGVGSGNPNFSGDRFHNIAVGFILERSNMPPPVQAMGSIVPSNHNRSLGLIRKVSFDRSNLSHDETSLQCNHESLRTLFGRNRVFQMSMYTLDFEEAGTRDPLSRGMIATAAFRVSGFDPSVSTRDIVRCLSGLLLMNQK